MTHPGLWVLVIVLLFVAAAVIADEALVRRRRRRINRVLAGRPPANVSTGRLRKSLKTRRDLGRWN